MTFEQWLSEWLANKLQRDIKTVITPESISVELQDTVDSNKWMRDGVFGIYCRYTRKQEAAQVSQQIQRALEDLTTENYINAVNIETEQAERTLLPSTWDYTIGVRIRHRRRFEW